MGDVADAIRKTKLDDASLRARMGDTYPVYTPPKFIMRDDETAALPARALVLRDAEQAVCSDRNAEYGEPIDNFGRWAGTCNALGYRGPDGRPLKPHDLAIIAAAGKLCRAMQTPGKRDHSVDTAGYGSLIYELVTLEG